MVLMPPVVLPPLVFVAVDVEVAEVAGSSAKRTAPAAKALGAQDAPKDDPRRDGRRLPEDTGR
eukprot:7874027-Alexandrium_andersonii.AAC.1